MSPLSLVDTSRLPISEEERLRSIQRSPFQSASPCPDPAGKSFNLPSGGGRAKFAEKRARTYLMVGGAVVLIALIALSLSRILTVNHAESRSQTSSERLGPVKKSNAEV